MTVVTVNPIEDVRWRHFVQRHPAASVFHTPEWLEALRRTYRFEPVVYATVSQDGALQDALVLCNVSSWLTGKRSVSLPFSDHCNPLVQSEDALRELLTFAHAERRRSEQRFF